MSKIKLEVVTPERVAVKEEVDAVTLPGAFGEMGILPLHTTLLAELGSGRLVYTSGTSSKGFEINGGLVEVVSDQVTVLAHSVIAEN